MRIYDSRLGRFLSTDPLAKTFPFYTPYQFSGNSPIKFIDLDGGEPTAPQEDLVNIRLINSIDKGNIIEGTYDPDDRLHIVSVEKLYDPIKKQAFFVHQEFGTNYYWNSSQKNLHIVRKADGTTVSNGKWERYDTYEQTQQKIAVDVPNLILGILGGSAVVAVAAPVVAPYATAYGTQVLSASAGSRFIAAGADAGIKYTNNLMDKGWGKENLKSINWTSSGLAFINPASIVTTGIGGNFLKFSVEDGFSKAVGGSQFNLKTATLSSIVDVGAGKLGDFIQGKAKIAGFKNLSGLTLAEVTSNAAAAPANVIVEAATKKPDKK